MFLDIWASISHGKAVGGSVHWGWVMGRLGDTGEGGYLVWERKTYGSCLKG